MQHSFDRNELIAAGNGTLFDTGGARLPLPPMLMFDRVTRIENGPEPLVGTVRAELDITLELWFFSCHFRGDPVMPGCLGLDALWQLLGFFQTWSGRKGNGRATGVGEVKFKGQVTPDVKVVEYGVDVTQMKLKGGVSFGVGSGWVKADGKQIYTATDLRVGIFPQA